MGLKTPVALLIFNRPDLTAGVFETIRAQQPETLLVVADGPRESRAGEAELTAATRAVIDRVDWPCRVLREFSDTNLGCRRRVASGISWVFQQVERAIILEDDCVPDPTFFRFCDELLDRYADDDRVMAISGGNLHRRAFTPHSYHFAIRPYIWGWATWRRAWAKYDLDMSTWPDVRNTAWHCAVGLPDELAPAWSNLFELSHRGQIDTWDYQWLYALWMNHGLSITPAVNLVSNAGFRADATHTTGPAFPELNAPRAAMPFPLSHPPIMLPALEADLDFMYATQPPPRGLRPMLGRFKRRLRGGR